MNGITAANSAVVGVMEATIVERDCRKEIRRMNQQTDFSCLNSCSLRLFELHFVYMYLQHQLTTLRILTWKMCHLLNMKFYMNSLGLATMMKTKLNA